MAVTLGDAVLYFSGNSSQLDKDLKGAETKTKGFFGGLAGSASKLIGGAIVGGAALATTAVVGIGAAAFGVSNDMKKATNEIQAQLGATEADAQRLGNVAKEVWKNNFGGSIEEATQALIIARQQLGNLSDKELQDATENAFRLSDAFGVDVTESLSAVRTLTDEFGLSQQEAFDLMAAGFQKGLNNGGDFLDTIGEYSNLFAESGADAGQFFSLLESGLAGGVLGTDKAADAFKEFQIRIQDGSDKTAEALAAISGPNEDLVAQIESGQLSIADAFTLVKDRLGDLNDPIAQQRLGVELFGTQWEDLGTSAALALDLTGTKLEDLAGATDKIDALYDNWPAMWEGVKRNALAALQPLGDKLLGIANDMMPQVQAAFDWLAEELPPMIDWVVEKFGLFYDYLQANVLPILQQMGDWLMNEGIPAYIEFVTPIIEQVVPGLKLLAEIGMNLVSVVWPMLVQATQFVIDNWNILEPIVIAVGVAILALTSPVTLVAGLIVALATAWANNWGDIQGKTQAVIDFIQPYIEQAMAAISAVVQAVTAYMSEWWDAHGENLMLIVRTVFDFIKSRIEERIKETQAIIELVLTAVRMFWEAWGSTIVELLRLAFDNLVVIVQTGMDVIGGIIDAVAALIRGDWEAFGEALEDIWSAVWTGLSSIVTNQIAAITAVVNNLIKQVKEPWDTFVDGLQSAWEDTWDGIVSYVQGIVSKVTDAIDDIIDAIEDIFDIDLPKLPGLGSVFGSRAGGTSVGTSNFNLTLNSLANAGSLVGEFQAMQARLGT